MRRQPLYFYLQEGRHFFTLQRTVPGHAGAAAVFYIHRSPAAAKAAWQRHRKDSIRYSCRSHPPAGLKLFQCGGILGFIRQFRHPHGGSYGADGKAAQPQTYGHRIYRQRRYAVEAYHAHMAQYQQSVITSHFFVRFYEKQSLPFRLFIKKILSGAQNKYKKVPWMHKANVIL